MSSPSLPQSRIVNGQLVGMRDSMPYNPITFGPYLQGGISPTPSAPPGAYGLGAMPSSAGAGMATNASVTHAAVQSPWSPVQSPLPWVVGALILGLLGLRYVHWEM